MLTEPLLQNSQQHISVDASFVSLIQYEDLVFASYHELSDRHSVSHEMYLGGLRPLFLKSDTVAYCIADLALYFGGYSSSEGDGTDSPGLGNAYRGESSCQEVLGNLSGLAASRLSRDNNDLVVLHQFNYLTLILGYRQLGG